MKSLKLRTLTVTGRFRTIDKPSLVYSTNFRKQAMLRLINSKTKHYA